MKRYLQTITSEEAVKRILEKAAPIDEEEYIEVYECKDRITSQPVFAKWSNPPFVCAAMDGFATFYEKTLEADLASPVSLREGEEAFRVNTGDALPRGTNSVIMIEDVEESGSAVGIRKPLYLWQNVRMVGEDVIEGDMLFPANQRIRVLDMGLLLSVGITRIYVRRKPRILIIPTGKELVDPYKESRDQLSCGQLIDFNSYTLWKLAEDMGFSATRCDIINDIEVLYGIVDKAIEDYDVIAINAGSSAGLEDYTEQVIGGLGTLLFHGVSMMPGKPTMFGLVRGKPVFGIPGYPVSAVLSLEVFLRPLAERLSGSARPRRYTQCITAYRMASRVGMEEIVRVNLTGKNGQYYAFPLPRGASVFSSMANADALIRIPENVEGYDKGETVTCELIRDEGEFAGRLYIAGSHDLSLDVLRDMLKGAHPDLDLVSTHIGSLSGIVAFREGITDLCTTHILDEAEGIYNIPAAKRYLPDRQWRLVHIAKRLQGMLVQRGNPKNIRDIGDLGGPGIRFVNRQSGSGTRILIDKLLREGGIEKSSLNGYDREESSHSAVGILVKESIADVTVAIYAVARLFSLDFIPLAEEDYDLLVSEEFFADRRFQLLMELISSAPFKERLREIGGYNTEETGQVKYVSKR